MKKLLVGAALIAVMFCVFGCEEAGKGTGALDVTVKQQSAKIEALEAKVTALEEHMDRLEASLSDVAEAYNELAQNFEDHMSKYHKEKAEVPRAKPPKKRVK